MTVELTIDIVGCESTASWDDVTSVYPNPALQADNNSVCAGESWLANLSGFQELTAMGDTPEDNIVWTLSDAGIGVDIELSQDYIEALQVVSKSPQTLLAPSNTPQG